MSDEDGLVSRAYVGLDQADVSVPGVVVIRQNGTIAFQQIATGKDDRLTAAQLLAASDRSLGIGEGAPGARGGYAVLERVQVRVDLGGGLRGDSKGRAEEVAARDGKTATAGLSLRFPLARYLTVGPGIRHAAYVADVEATMALTLRLPILADAAAIELTGLGGYVFGDDGGPTKGVRLGAWVALDPRWALQLEAGFMDGAVMRDATVTFGVSRLIERR